MDDNKKKPIDITSRKSMLEHGIIVTDRSMRLKDPEKVVAQSGERMRKVLEEAERLAREYERVRGK